MRLIPLGTSLIACCLFAPSAAAFSFGVDCTNTGLGAQLPDQVAAYLSDPDSGLFASDSFRPVAVSSTVTSVCWWGVYSCGSAVGDDFTITYYENDGSQPGAIKAGPFSVIPIKAATGAFVDVLPEFVYRAEHPPVLLSAECTWISIVNDPDSTCLWTWETSSSGDGAHVLVGSIPSPHDLAFSLGIDVEPFGCAIEGGFEPYCFGTAPAACNCGNHGAPGNGCANAVFPGGANLSGSTPVDPPNVADDQVELVASHMTPLSICLFLQAPEHVTDGVGLSFGDGLLCLQGSVRRLAIKGTGLGTARYPGPFDTPLSERGMIRPTGGRAYYQVLFRDARQFGPCGSESRGLNWTNALRIDWE